jgi:hypothetical protein
MGAGMSNGSGANDHILKSRRFYDKRDIDLCTCTPPPDICLWGMVCPILLRNTARNKIQLLEKAQSDIKDTRFNAQKRLIALHNKHYCCNGCTYAAVEQMAIGDAMSSMGNGQGSTATALYDTSFIMAMRSELTNDNSGNILQFIEDCVCGSCVNCNNAFVVHRAVDRWLLELTVPNTKTKTISTVPVTESMRMDRSMIMF